MKENIRKIPAVALIFTMILMLFAGCTPKLKDITLRETEILLTAGESYQAQWTISPEDAETVLAWHSDNEAVATVSPVGNITAKAAGVCVVMVTADTGLSRAITVEVLPALASVEADVTELELVEGETYTLKVTTAPAEALTQLRYESSDEAVATVEEGVITAVGAGTATIAVTAHNGLRCEVSLVVLPVLESVQTDISELSLLPGESYTLEVTTAPAEAIAILDYESSNERVVTVEDGTVTAVGEGSATVTVYSQNGLTAQVAVTVSSDAMPQAEQDLLGSYVLDILVADGDYITDGSASLEIYEDYTGTITTLDGSTMSFTWSYQPNLNTEECYIYFAEADGESYLLMNFHSGESAGYVSLYSDENNMMLFLEKE